MLFVQLAICSMPWVQNICLQQLDMCSQLLGTLVPPFDCPELLDTHICGSPVQKLKVIPLRISIASLPSKRRIAELPLRVGLIRALQIHQIFMQLRSTRMSPTLNRKSAKQRFEGSDSIEIHNGITFNFYTGLPHMQLNPIFHDSTTGVTLVRKIFTVPDHPHFHDCDVCIQGAWERG